MMIRERGKPVKDPVLSISADIIPYDACARRYRYYDVLGFPQSDTSKLWPSEFTVEFEHELYRRWSAGDVDADDLEDDLEDICESIVVYLESKGMETDKNLYSEDWDRDRLLNHRMSEVARFMISYVYPLMSEHCITVKKHCDGTNPCSVSSSFGVLGSDRIRKADTSNPLIESLSHICPIDTMSDVPFLIKGMDLPDAGASHQEMHLGSSMQLCSLRNIAAGREPVSAGLTLYLNELWLSKSRLKELSKTYPDPDVAAELKEGKQFPETDRWRRCMFIISYDATRMRDILGSVSEKALELSSELAFGSRVGNGHWTEGEFNKERCDSCDFKDSCSVILDQFSDTEDTEDTEDSEDSGENSNIDHV